MVNNAVEQINNLEHKWPDDRRDTIVWIVMLLMGLAILATSVFTIRHVLKYETVNQLDTDRAGRYEEYIENDYVDVKDLIETDEQK